MARVEAVLFASAGPVPRARLARGVWQGVALNDLLGDLRADLAGRPCEVVAVGDSWMLRTQPAYGAVTLAAIATRQPVTRAELARLFGRRIGAEILGRLLTRDVVGPGPRSPIPGAPRTLVTMEAFLAMFGIRSLDEIGEGEESQGPRGTR